MIRKACVLLFLTFLIALTFSFSIRYWFESSNLNIEVTPSSSYMVETDGSSVTFEKSTSIKWSRGKVDWVLIKDLKSNEERKILVVGVHDFPPKISINFPTKVGLGVYHINISVKDDWDPKKAIKIEVSLDGEKINEDYINTFFLHSGSHIIKVIAQDTFGNLSEVEKKFEVYIGFPPKPQMIYKEPDSVIFPKKPNLYFLYPLGIGLVKYVGMISRDTAKIARKIDDFGNLGEVFVIPPVPKNLTPISKKLVITSVSNNLLLLSGGSPFPIIGKVVLPKDRIIAIGENTHINMTTGQLIVKGTLLNISSNFSINGGNIKISDGGQVYLSNGTLNLTLEADKSDVIFLSNIKSLKSMKISNTKYVVIENIKLKSLECIECQGIYFKKSSIDELHVSNSNEVILQDSTVNTLSIEDFTKGYIMNSEATTVSISTLSKVLAYRSRMNSVNINSASTFMVRESEIEKVSLDGFSLLESYITVFSGKIIKVRSEVIQK